MEDGRRRKEEEGEEERRREKGNRKRCFDDLGEPVETDADDDRQSGDVEKRQAGTCTADADKPPRKKTKAEVARNKRRRRGRRRKLRKCLPDRKAGEKDGPAAPAEEEKNEAQEQAATEAGASADEQEEEKQHALETLQEVEFDQYGWPVEIWQMIFLLLEQRDLFALSDLCRLFRSIVMSFPWYRWYYEEWPVGKPPEQSSRDEGYWFALCKARDYLSRRNKRADGLLREQRIRVEIELVTKHEYRARMLPKFQRIISNMYTIYIGKRKTKSKRVTHWMIDVVIYSPISGLPLYLTFRRKNKKNKMWFYWGVSHISHVQDPLRFTWNSTENARTELTHLMKFLVGNFSQVVKPELIDSFLFVLLDYRSPLEYLRWPDKPRSTYLTCLPQWPLAAQRIARLGS